MPCRAAPPPPPPHAAQDMAPSTASLSNPLVYRLRTCCLLEFLPRVSLAQKSLPIQVPSIPGTAAIASASTSTPAVEVSNMTNSTMTDRVFPRPNPTQLSVLFNQNNLNFSNLDSPYPHSSSCCCDYSNSLPVEALPEWQSPVSAIQLPQLQTTLASRFLSWALSEKVLSQDPQDQQESLADHCGANFKDTTVDAGHDDQYEPDKEHPIMINPTLSRKQAQRPVADPLPECTITRLNAAAQDWAAAHDLIWPEGDYYMAKKILIREGVAHLKRGRRYIFVEPVLGPAASYLYPKWVESEVEADTDPDAEDDVVVHPDEENVLMDNGADFEGAETTADVHEASLAQVSHSVTSDATVVSASVLTGELGYGLEQDREQDDSERAGDDKETGDDGTEGRAQAGQTNKGAAASLTMEGERVEKEDADENTSASSSTDVREDNANSSNTPPPPSSSSSSSIHSSNHDDNPYTSERLEPYSPLLDPSMDGQDQFEYGLYELQFIPKIQYLLPQQFLPTRQSFIVHLDEDRPTLASPVPLHSKRSECRCQLMMRKVLMQRDLLQVWPVIPPVRTLQERMQEAEEEARILEIKQKVKLQTMHWRKALMTQTVACG